MIKVNLKSLLKEKGMTMTELHKLTGITQNALSLMANGKSNGIQFNTIEKILKVTGAKIEELLEYTGEHLKIKVTNCSNEKYQEKQNTQLKYQIHALDKNEDTYTVELEFDFICYYLAKRKLVHIGYTSKPVSPTNIFTKNFYSDSSAIINSVTYLIVHELIANHRIDFVPPGILILFDWNDFVPLNHSYRFEINESSSLSLLSTNTPLEISKIGNVMVTDSSAYIEVHLT